MRTAVRAIIIRNDQLLIMHRNKFGMEYETLVGGGIQMGEAFEAALYRELREESGVVVTNPRLVFIEEAGEPYGSQYVYLCEYASGEPALSPHSEEYAIAALGSNLFEPKWLPLAELPGATFRSEALKQAILKGLSEGFPAEPLDITAS